MCSVIKVLHNNMPVQSTYTCRGVIKGKGRGTRRICIMYALIYNITNGRLDLHDVQTTKMCDNMKQMWRQNCIILYHYIVCLYIRTIDDNLLLLSCRAYESVNHCTTRIIISNMNSAERSRKKITYR